jgi:hypothetical protein
MQQLGRPALDFGSQWAVTQIAEELRKAQGLNHAAFAKCLGRDKGEWSILRRQQRVPSATFTAALRSYARTVGGIWPSRIDVAVQQDALARVVAAESADTVPA